MVVGYVNASWLNIASATPPQPAGANWIGIGVGNAPYPNNVYTLNQSINVDPSIIDPTTINVTGNYTADDYVTAIQVGASIFNITPILTEYATLQDISTTAPGLGSLFQTGDNTLTINALNGGPFAGGLYANVSISAQCAQPPTIAITKTANIATALAASDTVSYTVTVSNTSATTPASNVLVSDPIPTGIDPTTYSWQCSGAACTDTDPHTGDLSQTIATLNAGESVQYAISATASGSATVTNTASASGSNLVCADGGALPCTAQVSNPFAQADMQASATSAAATIGTPVTVTLVCTNAGAFPAANATCVVTPPAGLTVSTVCSTPANPLAVNGSITCQTTFTPASATPVTLVVTAGSDTPDPNRANDTAKAIITPIAPLLASTSRAIPTLSEMALLLLAALLGVTAVAVHRRGR